MNKIKLLSKNSIKLKKGKKQQIKVSVLPASAKNRKVTYKTSNSKVAIVSKTGVITAKNKGNCVISAITQDGKKKVKVKVTVY